MDKFKNKQVGNMVALTAKNRGITMALVCKLVGNCNGPNLQKVGN